MDRFLLIRQNHYNRSGRSLVRQLVAVFVPGGLVQFAWAFVFFKSRGSAVEGRRHRIQKCGVAGKVDLFFLPRKSAVSVRLGCGAAGGSADPAASPGRSPIGPK
jgi:hypothetical protein